MSEYRINYNPFNKKYIAGTQLHAIQLYNKKEQKNFNEFIRCIIIENTLYIRLYYPFDDIDTISKYTLYQASYELLHLYINDIIHAIQQRENIIIDDVKFNVTNDILKGLKLINI